MIVILEHIPINVSYNSKFSWDEILTNFTDEYNHEFLSR